MADSEEPVTFLNSAGEEISNDPRWLAKRVLENAGEGDDAKDAELAAAKAEIEALKAQLAAADSGVEDEDDEEDDTVPYADVKGKDLAALAKERGINLKNEDGSSLKAGEVRAALAAQDGAQA